VPNAGPPPPPPAVAGPSGPTRLNEAFDLIRREFDIFGQELITLRNERDELEARGASRGAPLLR
jgi:hypothetical protein